MDAMTADRALLIAQVRTLQEKWREAVYSARRTQPRSYHVSDMLQQQLLKCADDLDVLLLVLQQEERKGGDADVCGRRLNESGSTRPQVDGGVTHPPDNTSADSPSSVSVSPAQLDRATLEYIHNEWEFTDRTEEQFDEWMHGLIREARKRDSVGVSPAQAREKEPMTEYDRLKAQKDAIVEREQRRIEGVLESNNVLHTLTERAKWYREGCPFLEDRDAYYASGDCARDAASDLETALAEIRVLERVLTLARTNR